MSYSAYMQRCAHDYLVRLIETHHGNISAAARAAGRNRTSFYRLLKKYCPARPPLRTTNRGNDAWQALQ